MPTPDEIYAPDESQVSSAPQPDAKPEEPPSAYAYSQSTDHPPIAPIPDETEHEVQSYGGAPEGGT